MGRIIRPNNSIQKVYETIFYSAMVFIVSFLNIFLTQAQRQSHQSKHPQE